GSALLLGLSGSLRRRLLGFLHGDRFDARDRISVIGDGGINPIIIVALGVALGVIFTRDASLRFCCSLGLHISERVTRFRARLSDRLRLVSELCVAFFGTLS